MTQETKRQLGTWLKERVLKNTLLLNGFVATVTIVFGLGYIVQVNQAAEIGQRMQDLQYQINELEVASQQLEFDAASNRSMKSVSRRVSILGMVRPNDVDYISTSANVAVSE